MEIQEILYQYHGHQIRFDQEKEDWYIVSNFKEQHHKSLQAIKNFIDRMNKKEFERVPVFVPKSTGYFSHSRGQSYEDATITSVGIDGTIFIVREGKKSAEHCRIAYIKNAKNKALIYNIGLAYHAKEKAEKEYDALRAKLEVVDYEALIKKALGANKDKET